MCPAKMHLDSNKGVRTLIECLLLITGPDTDWAWWFGSVEKGAKTGKDNGFSVLFDIESYDYGYYDEGSEGLKVAIVHHLDMPIIRQRAFHVAPGTENQIPVTPTLYTTNPQVRTLELHLEFSHFSLSFLSDYFPEKPLLKARFPRDF